jgi:putative DNA primase/helicase
MLDSTGFTVSDQPPESEPPAKHEVTTEDDIATIFAEKFKDRLRYCHDTGSWFEWNGSIWRKEETQLAFDWCRYTCREFAKTSDNKKVKVILGKASTARAVESFARADRAFAVKADNWDKDTFLLGTPEGTVDLRTGELRHSVQTDFITKKTSVAPADTAACPLWLQFLDDATRGDKELIRFLQQWCGYSLTGDTREEALLFIFGPGGNGKSVFLKTFSDILGDYATSSAMDTFTASHNDRHPTDLAKLRGARLVSVSETEEGRAWAESRITQVTGRDMISARFMRQDFFEYMPQFKLTFVGNHKPALKNVGDATRRRFNFAPFTHKPTNPDTELKSKLEAEYPGILRWMINGCLEWQKLGLIRPSVVVAATDDYFATQDTFRQWVEDNCETGQGIFDTFVNLFSDWQNYAQGRGEKPGTSTTFGEAMQRLGCTKSKSKGKRGYFGIRVRLETGNHGPAAHQGFSKPMTQEEIDEVISQL